MTADEVRTKLRKMLGKKSQKALAEKLNISTAYLCEILNGRRDPGEKVLNALGLQRSVAYLPRKRAA